MDIKTKTLQYMVELGFLAADMGRAGEAERIFQGLSAVRPDREAVLLALAYARLTGGFIREALDILQNKALVLYPDNEVIRNFTGLALFWDGRQEEGRVVLERVVASGSDPVAVAMARGLLADLGT